MNSPFAGLSPAALATLSRLAPAAVPATPPQPAPDDYSPEAWNAAIQATDVSPEAKAVSARVNTPDATVASVNAQSNPATADPHWNPDEEAKKTEAFERQKQLDAANPQGPAGSDGFPTYKDLSSEQGGGQSYSPGVMVPAHWQDTTREHTREQGMDPSQLEPAQFYADEAAGAQLMAKDAKDQSAAVQGRMDAIRNEAMRRADEGFQAQQARINLARQQYTEQEMGKLDDLSQRAQAKIDPEAYWKDHGGGIGKVFAAIAIGLGQFGASMRGGPNTAYEIINGAINRNIEAQVKNADNAARGYGVESNLYAQNLAIFGDKERALAATRLQYVDQVNQAIQQQLGHIKGSADQQAANADFMAKWNADRSKTYEDFAKLTAIKSVEKSNEAFKPAAMVGGGMGQKGKDALYVPSLGGYARDEQVARKLNDKAAMRMSMNENARQINALLEEAKGLNSATSPIRLAQIDDQIKALVNDTLQTSTVLKGQGAMSEGDKLVAEAANNLKGVQGQFRTDKQINNYQANIKQAAIRQMRDHRLEGEANGIQLGREQYVQGPNGPEPVRKLEGRNKAPSKQTQNYDDLVQPPKGVVKGAKK